METYTLVNLLIFLKTQQKNEYRGIEAIFEILEDVRIPQEDKMPIVLAIFRQLGLEEEYVDEPFEEDGFEPPVPEKHTRRFLPYRMDCLRIPILDCVIPYDCILN